MITRHSEHLTISGIDICLFMVVINEHEAMGVKTVYLIDVTMFQIIIIRAVITHETGTHKKNHLL
jgi:hypothetical protein